MSDADRFLSMCHINQANGFAMKIKFLSNFVGAIVATDYSQANHCGFMWWSNYGENSGYLERAKPTITSKFPANYSNEACNDVTIIE